MPAIDASAIASRILDAAAAQLSRWECSYGWIKPPDLGAAIATQPMWLQIWVLVMVVVNLSAIAFVVSRQTGKARLRIEALAILASFVAAGASVLPM